MYGNNADQMINMSTTQLPEPTTYGPVPAGTYLVEVEKAEVNNTKSGQGKYIRVQLSIVGPSFAGRKLFSNITFMHPNPMAMEIGQRDLAAILRSGGRERVGHVNELLNIRTEVRVKVNPPNEWNADEHNEVVGFQVPRQGGQSAGSVQATSLSAANSAPQAVSLAPTAAPAQPATTPPAQAPAAWQTPAQQPSAAPASPPAQQWAPYQPPAQPVAGPSEDEADPW